MLDRNHVERFLELNGVSAAAPDEEIRSLLISARWHQDDVEAALVVLREDQKKHTQRIDSVHKVFQSSQRLNPETLSSLLGIDIELSSVVSEHKQELESAYRSQIISIALVSVALSILFTLGAMWIMQIGFFYDTPQVGFSL